MSCMVGSLTTGEKLCGVNIEQSEICRRQAVPAEDAESFTERGGKAAEAQNNSTAHRQCCYFGADMGTRTPTPLSTRT